MKNKLIFICILLVSFLLILISCRKKGRPCDVNYKIGDILIPQNIEDSINETKYDAIQFKIYTRGCYYVEEIRCELPNGILIDSYKSIIIITLNKYNLTYDSLDTISNNFKIEYLKPDNRGMPDYEYYNSLSELFQTYQSKPLAHDIAMKLIAPPDTIRQLKLKIIIDLWDNREFVLTSKPVIIKP